MNYTNQKRMILDMKRSGIIPRTIDEKTVLHGLRVAPSTESKGAAKANSVSMHSREVKPASSLTPEQRDEIRTFALVFAIVFYLGCIYWVVQKQAQRQAVASAAGSKVSAQSRYDVAHSTTRAASKLRSFNELMQDLWAAYENATSAVATTPPVLATAEQPEHADQLVHFADRLIADGHFALAEPYYRKAMRIYGLCFGERSRQYSEVLRRLAIVCHHLKRYQEWEEINAYAKRLQS